MLVQPADALYSEVGHGDGIEKSHDKVIVSETSDNVSMEVQLSDEICKANLDFGLAVEDKNHSVNHKKVKLSENVASGCSDALEQQPSLLNLLTSYLPGLFRRATFQMRGQMRSGIVFTVHTSTMFGVNFVMRFDLSIEGKAAMDPEEEY